ncbi:carcinoembryonic antigen-related cell adhesion molecule 1 [Stigmatopora argus]
MKAPLVYIVIISVLSYTTDHVRAQGITASQNPVPVGTNVTLFSDNPVNTGAWIFNNKIVAFITPDGTVITDGFTGMVVFNTSTSSLTVISAKLENSGTYTLQDINSNASQLNLSVQEPISNVSLTVNGTDLVEFNDSVVLTCAAETGTSLHYMWLNKTAEVMFSEYVQLGADSSQLIIMKVTRYDEGPFRCDVINGINQEISPSVQFNISYGPTNAAVSVIPLLETHTTGSNITLLCSAESKPMSTIQWMVDGMNLNHTGEQFSLTLVAESDSGEYQCLLYNSVTSRFSSARKMIRIMAPITAVTVNDMGRDAVVDESFTLKCHVTGEAETIEWWMNNVPVSADNRTIIDAGNQTLTLHPAHLDDVGQYKCRASNAVSNMTSSTYTLEVFFGPETPVITAPPVALTGSQVLLNCSSRSDPASTYIWSFMDIEVASTAEYLAGPLTMNMSGMYTCMAFNNITRRNSSTYHMLTVFAPVTMAYVMEPAVHPILNSTFNLTCDTEGSVESITWRHHGALLYTNGTRGLTMNNATLTFEPLMLSDNGVYSCEASNPLSSLTSENYTLNVIYGPGVPIVTLPLEALEGTSIQLNCSAMSYPPSQYTWLFNDTPVANTSVYQTAALSQNMIGTYTCKARNNITGENSSANTTLTVIEKIKYVHIEVPPHPPVEGYNFMMICNVSRPVDKVLWKKNGDLLVGDDRIMMSMDNLTVTFNELHRNDSGQYHCWAFSSVQNILSSPHIFIVNFGPETPMVYGPSIALKGQSVNFTCSALSQPDSHLSWWHNMTFVVNSSVLLMDIVMLNMSGNYTCKAQNPVTGKNSSSALTLLVIEGIDSVRVENNTIPIDGDNFTLTCEVDGHYTSIQWKKDGVALTGNKSATNHSHYYIHENRLHFAPLNLYHDGMYMCVASNLIGQYQSPSYELLVNYGPLSVTINGPDLSAEEFTVSIECVADSRPESEYQWFLNDIELLDIASSSVIDIPLLNSTYTCKATNRVTNISMSTSRSINTASGLHFPSQKILVIVSVFIMSVPVLFH